MSPFFLPITQFLASAAMIIIFKLQPQILSFQDDYNLKVKNLQIVIHQSLCRQFLTLEAEVVHV